MAGAVAGQLFAQTYPEVRVAHEFAYCTPEPIVIDGVGNDYAWQKTPDFGGPNYNTVGGVLNPSSLNYKFKTAVSDSMFYMYMEVSDDILMLYPIEEDPGESWQYDAVEVTFLMRKNVEFPMPDFVSDTWNDPTHVQLRFVPFSTMEDSVIEGHGYNPNGTGDARDIWGSTLMDTMVYGNINFAFNETIDGYNLELGFKLDMFKALEPDYTFELEEGDFIGFEVQVRDYDSDATAGSSSADGVYTFNEDQATDVSPWRDPNVLGKLYIGPCFEPNAVRNAVVNNRLVYPNPASQVINLQNIEEVKNLTITDITGKKMMRINQSELKSTLDISSLKSGLYIISVENINNQISTMKFMVK